MLHSEYLYKKIYQYITDKVHLNIYKLYFRMLYDFFNFDTIKYSCLKENTIKYM